MPPLPPPPPLFGPVIRPLQIATGFLLGWMLHSKRTHDATVAKAPRA